MTNCWLSLKHLKPEMTLILLFDRFVVFATIEKRNAHNINIFASFCCLLSFVCKQSTLEDVFNNVTARAGFNYDDAMVR